MVQGHRPDYSNVRYIEVVLSGQRDTLEPRLICNSCGPCGLAGQFDARPAEIHRLLRGNPERDRTRELPDGMRVAGLPA